MLSEAGNGATAFFVVKCYNRYWQNSLIVYYVSPLDGYLQKRGCPQNSYVDSNLASEDCKDQQVRFVYTLRKTATTVKTQKHKYCPFTLS